MFVHQIAVCDPQRAPVDEMTSEIDDPSVETDSCDSLERVGYRPWLNGTSGAPRVPVARGPLPFC